MQKEVSPKIVVLTFGILTISFLAAFYVVAWQEPSQAPPGGNVPTPLNVGPTGQSKEGGLILNTGGAPNALIIDKGKLCLGADCRSSWPSLVESDPQVGTLTSGKWCTSDGSQVNCTSDASTGPIPTGLYGWVYISNFSGCVGSLPPANCNPGCGTGYTLVNTGTEAGAAGWWGGGGVIGRYYSCYKQ